MKRSAGYVGIFCSGLALILFGWQMALAQSTTGSVYGRVVDPSGAVVVGAQIVATNQATGVAYRGQSDAVGNFTVFSLPPGTYEVTAAHAGFETAKFPGVLITIDQKQLLNFTLTVGASTQQIEVTAAPTLLKTQTSETGDVIRSHDILDLPLLGRTFYDLTGLSAGVANSAGNTNAFNFSINGQREYANSIQIDGVESTTNRTQDITATPSVDAVEEFKVATGTYGAEFGRSAGGEVSIQTKSGSNQWHGDAYEFFRPNFTAAKDYGFNGIHIPPSILKQHNYGGTFGGPIRKDKTFFFVSYEATYNADAFNYLYSVPPIGQIKPLADGSVDLSGLLDPLLGTPIPEFDPQASFSSYGGVAQQFPGNIIPASEVSKAGLNTLLNFFPKPNLPGTDYGWFNNFLVHSPSNLHNKQADARLDQNFSTKDRLSAVFHYNDLQTLITGPFVGLTPVPEAGDNDFGNNQSNTSQEYSVTETHMFSPTLLNEARFGYTRYSLNQYPLLQGQNLSNQYGMGNINVPGFPATYGYPYIQLYSGYFTGGSTYKPFLIADHNWQISDNVVVSSIARHEIKFGGDFRRLNSFPNFSIFPTGYQYYGAYFSPSTSDPTFAQYFNPNAWFPNGGSDIADLLVGLPFTTAIGLQLTNPHTQSWEMEFYGQDTYKVTPKLTLNYGLRYEYQAPYSEANNFQSNYDPVTDSLRLAGRGSNSSGLINSRWTNFAPRLGFAYQLAPRTVLRGGFGLFYSPENDAREDILTKNYPFAELNTYGNYYYNGPCVPSPQVVCNGLYNYQLDAGIPRNTTIPIPAGASSIPASTIPQGANLTTYSVNPNLRTGYSEQYSFSLQQQLGADFVMELGYVGSKSHALSYKIGDLNFNLATGSEGLVSPNLGQIQGLTDSGWGEYNSLQIKVTKRVSRNLNFLANYTYSHNLDNGPAPFNLGVNSDYPQNAYNLNEEIASADADLRHNFVFSGLYHLPFGRGQAFFGSWGKVPEFILGGWQLNGIFSAHTGTPINIVRGASLNTCPGVRPNLIGNPNVIPPSLTTNSGFYYFNPQAFDITPFSGSTACAPGDVGRNFLTGPGFVNVDGSIFKEFNIKERAKLQTRLEVFNMTNTPHFQNPDGVATDGTFGQITRAGQMRILQLAAKFIF